MNTNDAVWCEPGGACTIEQEVHYTKLQAIFGAGSNSVSSFPAPCVLVGIPAELTRTVRTVTIHRQRFFRIRSTL